MLFSSTLDRRMKEVIFTEVLFNEVISKHLAYFTVLGGS